MTNRERENITLSFGKPAGRGSVEETFYPWTLTAERFKKEGIPAGIADGLQDITNDPKASEIDPEKYLKVKWGEGVLSYEKYLGFDPVRRISFILPFRRFDEKLLEETAEYTVVRDICGRHMKRYKGHGLVEEVRPVVSNEDDWVKLREHGDRELEKYFSKENIVRAYGPLKEGHDRGNYSVRLNIEGFFWTPQGAYGH